MRAAFVCGVAFVSGAVFEMGCVFWVHNSQKARPGRTALWSMLNATCEVLGVGGSITEPIAAPFFVLGYGVGSYLGVLIAKRRGPGTNLVARQSQKLQRLRARPSHSFRRRAIRRTT